MQKPEEELFCEDEEEEEDEELSEERDERRGDASAATSTTLSKKDLSFPVSALPYASFSLFASQTLIFPTSTLSLCIYMV